MNNQTVVLERILNAPPDVVWRALTNCEEMRKWYFNLAEFKAEVGFEFSFSAGSENAVYVHRCRVTEVDPYRKLSYTWRYDGFAGDSRVTFELIPEDGQTRLRLTHSGLETFAANGPDFAITSFEAGWTYIVGTSLAGYVEGQQRAV